MKQGNLIHKVKHESGQALLEFACISMILLVLAGGVIDGVRVIRYNIILNGAVTDMVSQISSDVAQDPKNAEISKVRATCQEILDNNHQYELGDGQTILNTVLESSTLDTWKSYYHYQTGGGIGEEWSGYRKYNLQKVMLEREVELLTPLGCLFFADSSGETHRTMKASASVRLYSN